MYSGAYIQFDYVTNNGIERHAGTISEVAATQILLMDHNGLPKVFERDRITNRQVLNLS
jgi:hypothetical protein